MSAHLLVLAKAPVAGRVKTRLCPPCTPQQAARLAAAALADTIDAVAACRALSRTLVLDGVHPVPPGWASRPQHGPGLAERLAHAYVDGPSLLVGMDTPQLTADLLDAATDDLRHADAVLGPATDGGWWALGLRNPAHAAVLRQIPTSTPTTGADTLAALRRLGLAVVLLPELPDVDTVADAAAVAALCPPSSRFAAAWAGIVALDLAGAVR
jgi:rSAM/selenodomain-associated transferase 1